MTPRKDLLDIQSLTDEEIDDIALHVDGVDRAGTAARDFLTKGEARNEQATMLGALSLA